MDRGGVCFLAENSSSNHYWDYFIQNFRPNPVYVIGSPSHKRKALRHSVIIESVADLPSDFHLVLMTPKEGRYFHGEIALAEFKHPDNAVYFFGPDDVHLSPEIFQLRKPDHLVYIPTATDDEMFAHVAASITFWSRHYG